MGAARALGGAFCCAWFRGCCLVGYLRDTTKDMSPFPLEGWRVSFVSSTIARRCAPGTRGRLPFRFSSKTGIEFSLARPNSSATRGEFALVTTVEAA